MSGWTFGCGVAARFAKRLLPNEPKKSNAYSVSVALMTENPASRDYVFGRGECAVVEWKAVDGCEERRCLRSVDGEGRSSEEACLVHPLLVVELLGTLLNCYWGRGHEWRRLGGKWLRG